MKEKYLHNYKEELRKTVNPVFDRGGELSRKSMNPIFTSSTGSTGTLLCIVFFGFVFLLFASVCISSDTYTSTVHLLKSKYKHGVLCNGQVNGC